MKKIQFVFLSICIVFFSACSQKEGVSSNLNSKMKANDDSVLIFFDPLCSYCDVGKIIELKELGAKVDLIHHLDILDNEKSYGICYLYEAIKIIDPDLAWNFLESLYGIPERDIESTIQAFLVLHNLAGQLNTITTNNEIETILLYDSMSADEMNISTVPTYIYRGKVLSTIENIKNDFLPE